MSKVVFTLDTDKPKLVDISIIEEFKGVKRVERKKVEYRFFRDLILSSEIKEEYLRIGKLPSGLYDFAIDKNGKGFKCLLVVKAGIKPLIYYDTTFLVPFPDLLFHFIVRNGVVIKSQVFSLKDSEALNDTTPLYYYPFGNVYENGNICWGTNTMNNICNLRDVEVVISTFFGSSTNDDLWSDGKRINVTAKDLQKYQRVFIESLQKEKIFPSSILKPTGIKVEDLWN